MANDHPSHSDLRLGDRLAVERTRLANERTLLAYVRTGFMFMVTGGTVLKFYGSNGNLAALSYLLMAVGVGVLILGTWRTRKVAAILRRSTS